MVIFASIDEPHGIYYGGETAAPLFREVLAAVASRFGMPVIDNSPRLLASLKKIESDTAIKDAVTLTQAAPAPEPSEAPEPVLPWMGRSADGRNLLRMPRLAGLSPREAIQTLQGHSFQLELKGTGLVRSQSPEGGKGIGGRRHRAADAL